MQFGLQARVVAGLTLLTTVLVVVVGWGWLAREEARLDRELEARQTRLAALIEHGMAGPIWNLDRATVSEMLGAIMADPEVHSVELQGLGLPPGWAWRRRTEPPVRPMEWHFDIHYQPVGKGSEEVIARATLISTRAGLEAKLAASRRLVGLLLATVLTGVVVGSLLLMQLLVKRPVQRLGQFAKRVASGELGAQVDVVSRDEIGDLTRQFNAMSQTLHAAHAELATSEARYRSLFQNASEGIFVADHLGRVVRINHALVDLLGLPEGREPTEPQRLADLLGLAPEAARGLEERLGREGQVRQLPLELRRPDGARRFIELSAHWTGNAGEREIEGIVTDVTQRREAELELQAHRDRLEEQVASRTAALREASERAEAAALSKGRFLATMSHELRTPLNGILGFVQLLQMDPQLTSQQQARLTVMRDSGDHLLTLIDDVLDMASIEAGKITLKATNVDLRALFDIVIQSLRPRADAKQLDLQLDLDPALPAHAVLDGQRLRQVLLNLLANAIKFTDAGHVRLQVDLVPATASGAQRLACAVSDTGIGLSPEQSTRLFQPFEQLGDLPRRQGGSGLGLSISQELVRLMGGQITVESTPGSGSRFSFEIELQAVA